MRGRENLSNFPSYSIIILGYIWNFIFSFGLTKFGEFTGISWMQTSWLTNPTRALMALIIVSAWQMSGYHGHCSFGKYDSLGHDGVSVCQKEVEG